MVIWGHGGRLFLSYPHKCDEVLAPKENVCQKTIPCLPHIARKEVLIRASEALCTQATWQLEVSGNFHRKEVPKDGGMVRL